MPIRLLAPPRSAKRDKTWATRAILADFGVDQVGSASGSAVDTHEDRILVLVEFVVIGGADRSPRRGWSALQKLRGVLARLPRLARLAIHALPRITADFRLQLSDIEENVGLSPQFIRNHGWLSRNRRGHRDAHALTLHRLDQRAKVAVARKQHHVVDMPGNLHGVDGKLNVHVALD